MADDLALRRGDPVFALQREVGAVAVVPARRWCHTAPAVPPRSSQANKRRASPSGVEVALGQQPAGVGAHQVRPVAPLADEVAIVPAALDHQIGEAERERAVGAGPHPQPDIGLAGQAGTWRGSTTISRMPRFSAATIAVAWESRVKLGL